MNFEMLNPNIDSQKSSERPRKVEPRLEQLLPTATQMIKDPQKIKNYINMKFAQLDEATKELLKKEAGKTGKKMEDRFREAIERAMPVQLGAVKEFGQTNEAFEKAVNKVIEKTLKGFRM